MGSGALIKGEPAALLEGGKDMLLERIESHCCFSCCESAQISSGISKAFEYSGKSTLAVI